MVDVGERLRAAGLRVSRARRAVADLVLATDAHPTADQVWTELRRRGAKVSRAAVYKTLTAFCDAGLLRSLTIEGRQVFDPRLDAHHHAVDVETGAIRDVPVDAVSVRGLDRLEGLELVDAHVVIKARFR
jgi:Fe2+ or Zn2+ uptake regulation protein